MISALPTRSVFESMCCQSEGRVTIGTHKTTAPQRERVWIWALVLLLVLALGYLYYGERIDTWQAYDDEGGYLYAAWRITLGEAPYRDFLTPQLPGFLYPGALILHLTGYSVRLTRLAMALVTLAAIGLFCDAARRLWGKGAALLMLPLLIVQQDMYWAARFFRPEAFMLFWGALGFWCFVRGYPQRKSWFLALGGVFLAFSMAAKLFGAFYMGGIGLFLLLVWLRERDWRDLFRSGLWLAVPFGLTLALLTGAFLWVSPEFIADVFGHHVRQGQGTPLLEVVLKALRLYKGFVWAQPLYCLLAALGVVTSLRWGERRGRVIACMLPTALGFMAMTRGLQERHLTYLVPMLAALAGHGLATVWAWATSKPGGWRTALSGAALALLVGLSLLPAYRTNDWVCSWEDHSVPRWTEFLQAHTTPEQVVISDYPGLNFFARRPTTPTTAGISRGAALSGQIMGAQLIAEMEQVDTQMVLLNVAQGAHQFVNLQDYAAFKAYVQTQFHLVKREAFDYRLMEVYSRQELWPGALLDVDAGHMLRLSGYDWLASEAEPGDSLQVNLRWQCLAAMNEDYYVSLQLVDSHGHTWGLGSKALVDIDKATYWDEEGLERAVRIPTSQWPLHETTIEVFELPVDLATPPGTYQVLLRVHPESRWAGLPLFDERGSAIGYDVAIGAVRVAPASKTVDITTLDLAERLDADLGGVLRLLGHDQPETTVRPGDHLSFSIYWQAPADLQADDLDLALRLVGADGTGSLTRAGVLGEAGELEIWPQGVVLRGQYDLWVPPETENGGHTLEVQVQRSGQALGEPIALRRIAVAGRERSFDPPEPQMPLGAMFGDQITLLGYDLEAPASLADGLGLTLHWKANQAVETPWTVFCHLIDAEGVIQSQSDSQPLGGEYPFTAWLPGEVVSDGLVLMPKDGASAGAYSLALGLYYAETGLRLALSDGGSAKVSGDRVLIDGIALGE